MKQFQINQYKAEPAGKLAKRMIYKDKNVIAFLLNIAQGESLPRHTHFDCTVLISLLSGKANVNVDGETVTMEEGDLVQLDGPENMSVDNTGQQTAVLYVTISPAPPSDRYAVDVDL